MAEFTQNPLFGLALCLVCFLAGSQIHQKTGLTLLNPLPIAILLAVAILVIGNIPVQNFEKGGNILSVFLLPATACLAVSIYHQRKVVARAILPILAGCFGGALASVGSILLMDRLLGLQDVLLASALPKSATTAIAVEISALIGGEPSITVALVVVTGISGGLLAPWFVKSFRLKSPVATGTAMGASSHAVGTSQAIKLGEQQGAASGVSIVITGIMLLCLTLLLPVLGLL